MKLTHGANFNNFLAQMLLSFSNRIAPKKVHPNLALHAIWYAKYQKEAKINR
jgi:hypothetical protein